MLILHFIFLLELWAVVNNAGLNAGAEMMWTTMDVMKRIFDVNTFGVIRLTKAFLPMLCKDKGRVVTVASAAGKYIDNFGDMNKNIDFSNTKIYFTQKIYNLIIRYLLITLN